MELPGAFGTAAKYLLDTYHVDPMWRLIFVSFVPAGYSWELLAFDRKITTCH